MKYLLMFLIGLSSFLNAQDYSNKTLVYPFYPRETGSVYKNLDISTLCEVGYTKRVRSVTTDTKHRVFKRYGVTKGHYREYEVDHIISLALGGNNAESNLFPQPYEVYLVVNGKNIRMGAREKDVVENNLRKRVCKFEITPKEAQEIITTDWVGYYLRLKHKI